MNNILLFFFNLLLIIPTCLIINACIYTIPREISLFSSGFFKLAFNYKTKSIIVYLLITLLFIASYFMFLFTLKGLLTLTILCILVAVTFIDIEFKIIPDRFSVIIILLGLINTYYIDKNYLDHIIGFFAISLPFLVIALATAGMGGGDIKLMAATGFYMGWQHILFSTIIGSIIGSIYSIILLIYKKANKKTELPFGPFLSIGIAIGLLFAEPIISWYLNLFLYL